ncbi:hypothetical protein SteCoe_26525 [Stentor coeruleus]|uniref:Uncharacterized protein n=1 Tax=Stentor coeruleus TaxID=5963 RepID=A0A1R2BCM3_9CILI|nr:hypothetical protein SteCoe_26525 [Stentor coeruleus]
MIQRDQAVSLLGELVQKLYQPEFSVPNESELLDEDNQINKSALEMWKKKSDTLVRELCIKWLDKEMNLDEVMHLWAGTLSEDQDFINSFNKLGEIIDGWKKHLRQVFLKDTSLYTMPQGTAIPEDNEILKDDQNDLKSDESVSFEEDNE